MLSPRLSHSFQGLAKSLLIQQPQSIDEQPSPLQGSTGIMSFTPKLVGSANEETRPFYPDEYDYLLIFTELRKCVTIRQDEKNLTTCQFRLSKYGKTKSSLQQYVAQNGDFDLFLFKIDFDFTVRNTLRYLFDQKTRRFGQTCITTGHSSKRKRSRHCTCAGTATCTKTCPSASTSCRASNLMTLRRQNQHHTGVLMIK